MKSRDKKGRFKKNEVEEPEFAIKLPSLKVLAYYAVLLLIFLPWLIIISKLKLTEKIISIFDLILYGFNGKDEETPETGKKNGLFY